jgi:hypothetical protein
VGDGACCCGDTGDSLDRIPSVINRFSPLLQHTGMHAISRRVELPSPSQLALAVMLAI